MGKSSSFVVPRSGIGVEKKEHEHEEEDLYFVQANKGCSSTNNEKYESVVVRKERKTKHLCTTAAAAETSCGKKYLPI